MERQLIKLEAMDLLGYMCWKDHHFTSKNTHGNVQFSILQTVYPLYVAPMEELASNLKVWIFPNFCHYSSPGFLNLSSCMPLDFGGIYAYLWIFSFTGGGYIYSRLVTMLCVPCAVPGRTIVHCLKRMARCTSPAHTLQSYQSGIYSLDGPTPLMYVQLVLPSPKLCVI